MKMQIEFLSSHDEAVFSNELGADIMHAFVCFTSMLFDDSDYQSVLVSFAGSDKLICGVNDSPYRVTFCEAEQNITLIVVDHEEEIAEIEDNLDEDGAYSIADIICSRPLENEEYVY